MLANMKIRFLNMQSHTDFVQLILVKRKKSYVLFIAALVHWLLFSLGHWLLRNLLNLLLVFRHSFKNVWIPCFIIVSSHFFFFLHTCHEMKQKYEYDHEKMSHKPLWFSALLKAGRNWGNGWVQKGWQLSCGDGLESRVTEKIRVGYQQWETSGTWGRVAAQPWPLTDSVSRIGPIRGSGWEGSGSGFLHAGSPFEKFSECHRWGVPIATPWGLDCESFRKVLLVVTDAHKREPPGATPSWHGLCVPVCILASWHLSCLIFTVALCDSHFLSILRLKELNKGQRG